MKVVSETREMSWFQETGETLALRQNKERDSVLDLILTYKYDEAKKKLEELQAISMGINLCQQTIARENDRLEAVKRAEEETKKQQAEVDAQVERLKAVEG